MPNPGERHPRRLISLAGFMGSGKTTVGRLLARQLGWHFTDLDARIEEISGSTIPAIFEKRGEAAFRELEREVLERTLTHCREHDRPTVLALGGGTLTQPASRELLASSGSLLLWLDCPMETLLQRCAQMTNRPLFRDEASFRKLYQERLPCYEQADYRVESGDAPQNVVERILALDIFDRVKA